MKRTITLGEAIGIVVANLVMLVGHFITIEVKIASNQMRIQATEAAVNRIEQVYEKKFDEVKETQKEILKQLTEIRIALEHKQNRKDENGS